MTERDYWESKPEKSKEKALNLKINKIKNNKNNNKSNKEREKSVWETKNLMEIEDSDLFKNLFIQII